MNPMQSMYGAALQPQGPRQARRTSPDATDNTVVRCWRASTPVPKAHSPRTGSNNPPPGVMAEPIRPWATWSSRHADDRNHELSRANLQAAHTGPTVDLAREVAAREAELRILRSQIAAKEQEAWNLEDKILNFNFRRSEASSTVQAFTAQTGMTAGNRHALLEASSSAWSSQVISLRQRLKEMEWTLVEKDEEVLALHQLAKADSDTGMRQNHLRHSLARLDQEAALLHEDERLLRKRQAMNEWERNAQTKIQQDNADKGAQRERRWKQDQLIMLEKDIRQIRNFMSDMEEKCRQRGSQIDMQRKRYEELLMEERLSTSAARFGHEAADEELRNYVTEKATLEAQLHQIFSQRGYGGSCCYHNHEVLTVRHTSELMALTECLQEVSHVLRDSGISGGAVSPAERAVDEAVDALRRRGEAVRSSQRSSSLDSPAGEAVTGAHSRSPTPLSPGQVRGFEFPRNSSPMLSPSPIRSLGFWQPGMGPLPLAAPSWGMPALVAPVPIGGAEIM